MARCTSKTAKGTRCRNAAMHDGELCGTHAKADAHRPSVYDPAMLEAVLLSAADGATNDAIAEACGIATATVDDWISELSPRFNPEFSGAVKRAKAKADNLMLTSHYHSGRGYDFTEEALTPSGKVVEVKRRKHGEVPAQKSWLANRLGWVGDRSASEVNVRGQVTVAPKTPEADLVAEAESILRLAAARRAATVGTDHGGTEEVG